MQTVTRIRSNLPSSYQAFLKKQQQGHELLKVYVELGHIDHDRLRCPEMLQTKLLKPEKYCIMFCCKTI